MDGGCLALVVPVMVAETATDPHTRPWATCTPGSGGQSTWYRRQTTFSCTLHCRAHGQSALDLSPTAHPQHQAHCGPFSRKHFIPFHKHRPHPRLPIEQESLPSPSFPLPNHRALPPSPPTHRTPPSTTPLTTIKVPYSPCRVCTVLCVPSCGGTQWGGGTYRAELRDRHPAP